MMQCVHPRPLFARRNRWKTKREWSVYCLASGGKVKYIGITCYPLNVRLINHISAARCNRSYPVCEWIREVLMSGGLIRIRALKIRLSASQAAQMEVDLIHKYKFRLVNSRSGGLSPPIAENELTQIKWKEARWPGKLSRRQRMLKKMANMRAAKERKRLANPAEREPKMVRCFQLELGVRDKRTGEAAWVDLRSVRDATRRISVVLKYYK